MSAHRLSIVIPTLRLDASLAERLARLGDLAPEAERIVVEADDAPVHSRAQSDVVHLRAPRGRGPQLNHGARRSRGDVLLFLHDDTDLCPRSIHALRSAFDNPEVVATCFRLRFEPPLGALRGNELLSRFETRFTTFGDQAMAVRRPVFDQIGGFPDWPLFEDVELARRLRRHHRIVKLPVAVTTSARRYVEHGPIRQQLRNVLLYARYVLGIDPRELARRYDQKSAG